MSQEKDILEQLKAVRKLKRYSYQTIADRTEEIGRAVSLSTVKRVFAEDSTLDSFRYDTTIQPIATVVLGIKDKAEPPAGEESIEQHATVEALKTIVNIKNETIEKMQATLDEKNAEIERVRAEYEKNLEQIRDEYKKGIADRNRTNRNLSVALFIVLAIILGVLVVDAALGSYGWIRRSALSLASAVLALL